MAEVAGSRTNKGKSEYGKITKQTRENKGSDEGHTVLVNVILYVV